MKPGILTLVEQKSNHNGPVFLDRWGGSGGGDGGSTVSSQDKVMSEVYLGRQICNLVACEEVDRVERHETLAQWRARLNSARFGSVHLGFNAFKQASMLLALFAGGDGYRVEEHDGSMHGCPQWLRWVSDNVDGRLPLLLRPTPLQHDNNNNRGVPNTLTKNYKIDILELSMAEESSPDRGGEDKTGFGGICRDCMLPSNISTTLVIDGRLDGTFSFFLHTINLPSADLHMKPATIMTKMANPATENAANSQGVRQVMKHEKFEEPLPLLARPVTNPHIEVNEYVTYSILQSSTISCDTTT
ncbi:hypothetical protein RJ640_001940 [Escallonia rubra]|uniref:Uncharacterized protein n=1 Tax=Escallonia rubra TaxID=112253 RepID=A0AA88U4Y6_9ASTE|nr:hypothetical protein RJ640_001940 [Escallonia rubra]